MTEFGDAVLQRDPELFTVADVGLLRDDPPVLGFDEACGFFQVLGGGEGVGVGLDLFAQIDRDDVGALLRHAQGVATALPSRSAGDERDLSFETTGHGDSFP